MISSALSGLEPARLWARFDEIRRIPRPSKHEERIRDHVLAVAADHGCETRTDATGNVVVVLPASPGREAAPIVILQGHLDMVCEKNADKVFDFDQDAIELRRDGDLLRADGTTLGSDNGVAVAAGLALIGDASVTHGPLELLFTVDEEMGLTGATQLDPALLSGRLLLNLDSEDEGVLTVGCAGGRGATLTLPVARGAAPEGACPVEVTVSGGAGGHSGTDIHLGRANAVKLLARVLERLGPEAFAFASIQAGRAHNAIPREAEAVIWTSPAAARRAVAAVTAELPQLYGAADPGLTITAAEVTASPATPAAMSPEATRRLLDLLLALPHGVLAMSPTIPGLVQTSSNLAVVRSRPGEVEIATSSRSMATPEVDAVVEEIAGIARRHGARAEVEAGYPGWTPDPSSPLLAIAVAVHERLFGASPEVSAVHAGLECGVLGEKVPGLDMVSFGPTIKFPHSPSEEVSVSSVERVLGRYLPALLATLAG